MRFMLVLLLLTGAAHAEDASPTFGNPFLFTEQGGEAIYRWVCAGCHQPCR